MSTPALVAHRGSSGLYPEHTLAAYKAAAAEGAAGWECDIRLTKDGVAICHHDATTGRCADQDLRISSTNLRQLEQVNFAARFPHHPPQSVLTLRQLCQLAAEHEDVVLFIETKHPAKASGRVETELVNVVKEFGWDTPDSSGRSKVVMMSFSMRAVRRMHTLAPHIPTVLLREPHHLLRLAARTFSRAHMMGPSITTVRNRPQLITAAHNTGINHFCWTVDGEADLAACVKSGITWVGTNYPQRSAHALTKLAATGSPR